MVLKSDEAKISAMEAYYVIKDEWLPNQRDHRKSRQRFIKEEVPSEEQIRNSYRGRGLFQLEQAVLLRK